jgi:hypothetical protein
MTSASNILIALLVERAEVPVSSTLSTLLSFISLLFVVILLSALPQTNQLRTRVLLIPRGNRYLGILPGESYIGIHVLADLSMIVYVKPWIFIENPNPCTIAIVPGSVAIAYRTSHR